MLGGVRPSKQRCQVAPTTLNYMPASRVGAFFGSLARTELPTARISHWRLLGPLPLRPPRKSSSAPPPPRRRAVRTRPPAPAARSGSEWARWRFLSSCLLPPRQAAKERLTASEGNRSLPSSSPFLASGPARPPPRWRSTSLGLPTEVPNEFVGFFFLMSTLESQFIPYSPGKQWWP